MKDGLSEKDKIKQSKTMCKRPMKLWGETSYFTNCWEQTRLDRWLNQWQKKSVLS